MVDRAVQRYSSGAIALHWLIAIALSFQLALGFAMPNGEEGFAQYQLHKSAGITILLLTTARIGWRLTHRPPPPVEGGWQHGVAQAVHIGLYAFMVLTPLTGWALVSTAEVRVPTLLFGTVPWPDLPLPRAWEEPSEDIHGLLAWLGIALIALHVAGAVRHHFLLRDGLMQRMAPRGSVPLLAALVALGLAVGGVTLALAGGSRDGRSGAEPNSEGEAAAVAAPALVAQADPAESDAAPAASEEQAAPEPEIAAQDAQEPAPPPTWAIQPGGRLAFSLANGNSTISGSFSDWGGDIRFDPADPATADIRIRIDLSSASVGDPTQDGMLTGPEFFDTGSAATATWRSTAVTAQGGGRYRAQGTLTLKGASRPQTVDFVLGDGDMRRRVDGTAVIDRTAFGIGGASASAMAPTVSLSFGFDAVGSRP